MILTNSGTPAFLTANLYERLNYKDTNGAIVRTENNLVSTLYCYSEINLKLALKSLGKDDADFVKGKELQDFREYLDLRPDSADKLEELTEHNLERDAWLQH